MTEYDCTEDVQKHKDVVAWLMRDIAYRLIERARVHDDSKLQEPEKALFDKWTPELKARAFGTDYYKQALDEMGEGIKHHYVHNRHHPEHFKNGVDDMTLLDVVEMFCDWCAAAERNSVSMDIDHAKERFSLSEQLFHIMINTMIENDLRYETEGTLKTVLTPFKYR